MSSLRIKSVRDLKQMRESKMLGDRAANRIERELESAQKVAQKRGLGAFKQPSKPALAEQTLCSLPPVQPADLLYQALVRRWGRFYSGGEVVWELQPFNDSGVRLDAALVNYRIGLEMLLTPDNILIHTQQVIAASMHTGMNLMAREL